MSYKCLGCIPKVQLVDHVLVVRREASCLSLSRGVSGFVRTGDPAGDRVPVGLDPPVLSFM